MGYVQGSYPIVKKREIAPQIWDLWICCPEIAWQAQAGQFVNLRIEGFFLRRPISICEICPEEGRIRLLFQVRGEGTAALARLPEDSRVDLVGPLGNGFRRLAPEEKVVVVGGGIGVPPLLQTAACYGKNATAILGFRTASAAILLEDFAARGCDTRVATDDGSLGTHGLVTELLEQRLMEGPVSLLCACGPMAMLKGVVALAERHEVPCQVSLEEHMACGVGACLVCACRTVKDGEQLYRHVCKDGPVFPAEEVVFE